VTALFWIIEVLTTRLGETASDFIAHTLAPPVAVGIGAVGLAAGRPCSSRHPLPGGRRLVRGGAGQHRRHDGRRRAARCAAYWD